jgi:cell wall-associated NlpC family hydrolase
MSIKNIVILCIYGCLIAGCGSISKKEEYTQQQPRSLGPKEGRIDSHTAKNTLYKKYKKWQGVRYQLGGLSRNGIDCSGFVHIVYKYGFEINLPRTAHLQSRVGKSIHKNDLKAGDLVFFRTSNTSRHVGIYLENRKFIHASTSKGVTISKLDNKYWRSRYWKSVRI